MTSAVLVPLPVVLPLVGAGVAVVVGRHRRLQRAVSAVTLTSVVVVSALLLHAVTVDGPQVVEAGGWPAPMGVVLVVDRLSALMLLVSAVVTLGVFAYSAGEGRAGGDEDTPLPIYHPTLLVLMAGVADTFISGDLFNLYVGFEILLAASFVLITLGGTASRIRAGSTYVVVSLLSSLLFLVSIALVYAATGTVNLAQLSVRLGELPAHVALMLHLALLVGFAVKAAVFPMSGWLPDSYPTAPAPVTAVFAGLLTKVGVYAILRTQTLLFPEHRIQNLLLVAAFATMVVGILGAVAQDDIKRLLSFTLVSHIGYMLFGIAVASTTGVSAAIFYVAHHITVQTTLFLVTGLVERRGGSTSLRELGGMARAAPIVAVLFFIPAMNLAGIPPFSGFLGKVGLLQAGAAAATPLTYLLIAGSVLTSLLTLYAIGRVWSQGFWRAPSELVVARTGSPASRLTAGLVVPAAAMVAVSVGLSIVAGPLFAYTDATAVDILHPSVYIDAVFPGGIR